jgi:hypothetical protein
MMHLTLTLVATAALASGCTAAEADTGMQNMSQGSEAACHEARANVERAVEAYDLLEGSMPANESAMVPNYLLTESPLMDIDALGNVIPAPGSGCS